MASISVHPSTPRPAAASTSAAPGSSQAQHAPDSTNQASGSPCSAHVLQQQQQQAQEASNNKNKLKSASVSDGEKEVDPAATTAAANTEAAATAVQGQEGEGLVGGQGGDDGGKGSASQGKPIPALPAPPEEGDEARTLEVDGKSVALDHLGPMVVGRDGTVSRIANWGEMTELERRNTLRILCKRNQVRLSALRGEKEDGAASS